jgi:ethanolamine utilization protein EutN
MQHGRVIGHATSTVKHASLAGWRLMVVQTLGAENQPDGEALLAIDNLGCQPGDRVLLNSDGRRVRELVGHPKSPARWFVCGIVDEKSA